MLKNLPPDQRRSFLVAGAVIFVLLAPLFVFRASAKASVPSGAATTLGVTQVPLDATKASIGAGETSLGDLVADAAFATAKEHDPSVQLALVTGGIVRYDVTKFRNGVYPTGTFTGEEAEDLLPFDIDILGMTLTGSEVREILERGVSAYPMPKRRFIQVSHQVKVSVDPGRAAQQVSWDEKQIKSPGDRIASVTIDGVPLDPSAHYRVALVGPAPKDRPHRAKSVNDGFVTIEQHPSEPLGTIRAALVSYLHARSPVAPRPEGRIVFDAR